MKFWDHQHSARSETRRLLLAFALAVAVLVAAVHGALVVAWLLMVAVLPVHLPFPAGFLAVNVGVSLMLVLGGWWVETSNLRAGGVKLAQRIGAREARPSVSHAEQRLCNIVQELSIAAHMPQPQVMVVPRTDAINAFAAGWDASDAVVAVTQGALDHLTREELQGMVAHELSHLHEGDTRLKMRLAGMVFGLELVYNFGDEVRELHDERPVQPQVAPHLLIGAAVGIGADDGQHRVQRHHAADEEGDQHDLRHQAQHAQRAGPQMVAQVEPRPFHHHAGHAAPVMIQVDDLDRVRRRVHGASRSIPALAVDVAFVELQRLHQVVDVGACRGDARIVGTVQHVGHDQRTQHADDHQHHQQFDQREATRRSAWAGMLKGAGG